MIDPTRDYIFETRTVPRSDWKWTGLASRDGHYRVASVQALPRPLQVPVEGEPLADDGKADILIVWEPVLLNERQTSAWNKARNPADHIDTLRLSNLTRATLEQAGITSITALKELSEDEYRRLRLVGPVQYRELDGLR